MHEQNLTFSKLKRELLLIGAGIVVAAAFVGAAIGMTGVFLWDKVIHHHADK